MIEDHLKSYLRSTDSMSLNEGAAHRVQYETLVRIDAIADALTRIANVLDPQGHWK